MLLAILLVLIVIACVIAPWLLGLAAAAAAVYGVALVSLIGIALVSMPFIALALWVIKRQSGHRSPEQIMAARAKEFNRQYMEESASRQKKEEEEANDRKRTAIPVADALPIVEPEIQGIACSRCSHVYQFGALVCPACGKSPPKS